eukprot:NODE_1261_length_1405_cov_61.541471_g1250_i0.p1 GENE.NODE_1261_length_1405_cov_61.541471_g1250_i0~~NODE_1261_length_1405_cov_61.541471_g1250_i0.p1  ORF type:complete len:414 (+),score=107.26 NODE_1261_length_1405_cov_61.541471_g1250_i0:78-1319(+)
MSALDKSVAFCVLQWLQKHKTKEDEGLDVAMQCISEVFKVSATDLSLDCGSSLETLIGEALEKKGSTETDSVTQEKLNEFIQILKQKGYFDNLVEGSPEYQEKYETAKKKFQQRNNPYAGLTAEQLKTQGNEKMTAGNFREAAQFYTKAIEADPTSAVYFCNRAAAFLHLKENRKALTDCERATSLNPGYGKAWDRYGTALFYEQRYPEAVEKYKRAVELEPGNQSYKDDLKAAEDKEKEAGASGAPGFPGMPGMGAGGFPDMGAMFNNPAFMDMANTIMQNPQFSDMVSNLGRNMGGGEGGAPPNMAEMFKAFQEQTTVTGNEGEVPEQVNTPFGQVSREQLLAMQNAPEIKENPKFAAIMEDMKTKGPMAIMQHMNDPEVMSTVAKMAGQLFNNPGAQPPGGDGGEPPALT